MSGKLTVSGAFQGVLARAWSLPLHGQGPQSYPLFLISCLTVYRMGEYASSRGEKQETHWLRFRHEAAFCGGACEGDSQKWTSNAYDKFSHGFPSQRVLLLRKKHWSGPL